MNPSTSPYRPHNPGHNYRGRGAYLITLVVRGRQPLLGQYGRDARHPEVLLTDIGRKTESQWLLTEQLQAKHGRRVKVHAVCAMPDHWHGVIEVLEPMNCSLGDIIQAFKASCTSYWNRLTGNALTPQQAALVRNMRKEDRPHFYESIHRECRPLFDDDYDDTICLSVEHLQRMIYYVNDNPRRAVMRLLHPEFMQKCLHIVIDGRDYGAFGDLHLLRWARKMQVFCHRKQPGTDIPYEQTDAFREDHDRWIAAVLNGATLLVSPGISKGEWLLKKECLEHGYPFIHIQKEPVSQYWKPEKERFDACLRGRLLILAPWSLDEMGCVNGVPSDSDYSRFHNMNKVAEEICRFEGEGRIVRK